VGRGFSFILITRTILTSTVAVSAKAVTTPESQNSGWCRICTGTTRANSVIFYPIKTEKKKPKDLVTIVGVVKVRILPKWVDLKRLGFVQTDAARQTPLKMPLSHTNSHQRPRPQTTMTRYTLSHKGHPRDYLQGFGSSPQWTRLG
jgi:hypothetical protein